MKKLTIRQENFAREYIRNCGNASDAYRHAYSVDKMKPESVNRKAYDMLNNVKIRSRIDELRKEIEDRSNIELDAVVKELAAIATVDPLELYDDKGNLKPLSEMTPAARKAISGIDKVVRHGENFSEESLKIRLNAKTSALDMLMKHLGGYEKDNRQKKNEVIIVGEVKEFG